MIPGARLAAAIHLIERIAGEGRPADDIVRGYFIGKRYAGAKDRRAVRERVYGVLRRKARLGWHLANQGHEITPRALVLADVILSGALEAAAAAALFDGSRHGPAPLDERESALAQALSGRPLDDPEMDDAVRAEVPEWIAARLQSFYGDRFAEELAACNTEAPMDMRVALARVTRDQARRSLEKEGIRPEPTPLSPLGLRLQAHSDIGRSKAFRQGLIEVQDEGSQLLALLLGSRPGMAVADYCAGAGGKTLALADRMGLQGGDKSGKRGRLAALDSDPKRLARIERRIDRGGLGATIERHVLGEDDPWCAANRGAFQRVLVDAPCTGTGTWRRHPAMKWRLGQEKLTELTALQDAILDRAAALVCPGGRLLYATCSLLAEENEERVAHFLGLHPGFKALDMRAVWAETLPGPCPEGICGDLGLRLSPASTGTDGFFAAALEKASD